MSLLLPSSIIRVVVVGVIKNITILCIVVGFCWVVVGTTTTFAFTCIFRYISGLLSCSFLAFLLVGGGITITILCIIAGAG